MRKALIVGINYYEHESPLFGCVDDAHAVKAVLERHADGLLNFDCRLETGTGPTARVYRGDLKDRIEELFQSDGEIALFYFAGHGNIEPSGGYLLATDSGRVDEGVSLSDIVNYANASRAKNKIIMLDSCHAGMAGVSATNAQVAVLAEGLTVLSASTAEHYATEENGRGVFTSLLVDALSGGAANIIGEVTPGSVYAHIDQSLGAWEQRPVFKTNIKQFVSLRRVAPSIDLAVLKRIVELFPDASEEFQLDPTYEPEMRGRLDGIPDPIIENTRKFEILQKYNRLNLLIPVGVPHMWNAAMESKTVRLTPLGQHYHRLVRKNRI